MQLASFLPQRAQLFLKRVSDQTWVDLLQLLLLFLADAFEEPSLALQLLDHWLVSLVALGHFLEVNLQFVRVNVLMREPL